MCSSNKFEERIPLIRIQAEEGTSRNSEGEENDDSEINASPPRAVSDATSREEDDSSNNASNESKSPGQRQQNIEPCSPSSRKPLPDAQMPELDSDKRGHKWRHVQAVMAYYQALRKIKRTKSNQRWMKLRTTVQLSSAMQKKPPLKREDSFLKRFSTRQIPEAQETVEDTGSEGVPGDGRISSRHRRRKVRVPRTVVNPDENFYFYWLWVITLCVLYNLWTLIVRQSFPELQIMGHYFWLTCDGISDVVFALDLLVQLRTGYLEQGLMVYDSKKLAKHYLTSRPFLMDLAALTPLDLLQLKIGINPIVRFPRFLKVYRAISCYYMVESRTVYPNFWRVINLIHILLILAHWFGCFYFLLSEAEGFQGDWAYPHRPGDYATLTRKYLGSLYWSTLTLTTIGDLPTPETNAEYVFTIVSYLIGVFIFATIVGQVGNVITNRNANRLEFERLLDGAKTYMRHHKVPGGMKRRVLRWYDYSWSRGRIQGGGDINTALGLLPDKLKTELALHVNLSVLKKVTIFQECQPEFLHDLVLKMKAYIFTPGDSICRKGEVAREMFIIADGILEVISETGRVLTTMQAGDFFGEIGILNLDGLNKRTADVRSVGYSELFSLSREDVLAAMKDYPEAQDILQTLGRRRLQEAKNMSRQKPKNENSPDKAGGDNGGPKRIVHKLRTDVKGIRNAIRSRSRAGRRSGDSMDVHSTTSGDSKVLRRMSRVESDDSQSRNLEDNAGDPSVGKDTEKSISPIGAGLPILSRLKHMKETQDREEKVAKQGRSTSVISTNTQVTPSTSSNIDSQPEVIGAGLPLLQRLLLLKAKEEREKTYLTPTVSNQHSSSDTISPSSVKSPLSPTVKSLSPLRKGSESNSPGKLQSPTSKTSRKNSSGSSDGVTRPKVSFKDRILKVQGDGTAVCQSLQKDVTEKPAAVVEPTPKTENSLICIPQSVVSKIKSPAKSVGSTFRDKFRIIQSNIPQKNSEITKPDNTKTDKDISKTLLQNKDSSEDKTFQKPWMKLRKAAIIGESKSSIFSRIEAKQGIKNVTESKSLSPTNICVPFINTNEAKEIENKTLDIDKNKTAEDSSVFQGSCNKESVEQKQLDLITMSPSKSNVLPINETTPSITDSTLLLPKVKKYRSIDDLSPEYGGLPFVKKLKILNERQKLAKLERVVKFRSSSLDYTSSSEDLLCDTLTRSLSEGSKMYKRRFKGLSSDSASHESNETLERQTLKSILKKLSEDVTPTESPERNNELKKLIRAPTLEGYAVRHSKFAKSVTFHRHTLPSPPSSAQIDPLDDVFETPSKKPTEPLQSSNSYLNLEDQLVSSTLDRKVISESVNQHFDTLSEPKQIESIYKFNSLKPEEIVLTPDKHNLAIISTLTNQKKIFKGSIDDKEYFGDVLLGIKQVIQNHLHDVQGKFQERFNSLENEIHKRDSIIIHLQKRIQELEKFGATSGLSNVILCEDTEKLKINDRNNETMKPQLIKDNSESEEISCTEEGFMRDSLDTVFATSPCDISPIDETNQSKKKFSETDITEDKLTEITKGIELSKLSYSEIQCLAEYISQDNASSSLSKDTRTVSKSKRLDLNLDGKAGTYLRKKAAKLKHKMSWEDQGHYENVEMQELARPISPHTTSEDRSLLSPEQSSLRTSKKGIGPFHFFGTHLENNKTKIKKTLSVDTGMHQTGKKETKEKQLRKFSLGSFFGNNKNNSHKPSNNSDVIVDIGSDCSWTDTESTLSSSDDESVPPTPVLEEFLESFSRRTRPSSSNLGSSPPIRGFSGSGGDWEVMMLADELEKREREKDEKRHHYSTALKELEEESDTQQREDSADEYSNVDESNSSSTAHLLSQTISETSFSDNIQGPGRERRLGSVGDQVRSEQTFRSRGLILRASSLDRETSATITPTRRFSSLRSCNIDSHKRL